MSSVISALPKAPIAKAALTPTTRPPTQMMKTVYRTPCGRCRPWASAIGKAPAGLVSASPWADRRVLGQRDPEIILVHLENHCYDRRRWPTRHAGQRSGSSC